MKRRQIKVPGSVLSSVCLAFGMLLSLPPRSVVRELLTAPAPPATPPSAATILHSECALVVLFCLLCRVLFYFRPRTFRPTFRLGSLGRCPLPAHGLAKTNRRRLLKLCVNMLVLLAAITSCLGHICCRRQIQISPITYTTCLTRLK